MGLVFASFLTACGEGSSQISRAGPSFCPGIEACLSGGARALQVATILIPSQAGLTYIRGEIAESGFNSAVVMTFRSSENIDVTENVTRHSLPKHCVVISAARYPYCLIKTQAFTLGDISVGPLLYQLAISDTSSSAEALLTSVATNWGK